MLVACKRYIQAADLCEERVAARLGLGRSDLRAVNLLETGPVAQGQLAGQLGLAPASVTALIDRLEAHGLVRRIPHPSDRRVTLIELLPRARQELAGVYRPIGSAVLNAASSLNPAEKNRVATLLQQWAEILDQQPN